jgi:hypothetical protein
VQGSTLLLFFINLLKLGQRMTNKALLTAHGLGQVTTHSVGGGEWSLEVHASNGDFLFELVGSNGTNEEADDLWGQLDELR